MHRPLDENLEGIPEDYPIVSGIDSFIAYRDLERVGYHYSAEHL